MAASLTKNPRRIKLEELNSGQKPLPRSRIPGTLEK